MIGIALVAAHMAGDYLFQSMYMAAHKLTNRWVRAYHVNVYTLCFLPVVCVWWPGLWRAIVFVTLLWVAHFVTDSHRWRTNNPWQPMPILQDQALHVAQIAILAGSLLPG